MSLTFPGPTPPSTPPGAIAKPKPVPKFPAPPAPTLKIVDVGSLLTQTNPATLNKPKEPSQQTVAGENSIIPLAYGRRRMGARVSAAVTYQGDLVLLCIWCLGEVDAIESIEVNDAAMPSGVTVTHYLGTQSQTADPTLVAAYAAATPSRVYTDALPGVAYSVVRISSTAAITGFPRMTAFVRGQKVNQAALAYCQLNGSTQYFNTSDSALTDINEDFELEVRCSLNDWTPATVAPLVTKWQPTGNLRSYYFGVTATGALELHISSNGTLDQAYTSSAVPAFTDGVAYWVKVVFVKNNGTNSTATFYTSTDGITYTQLGTVQTAATIATIFNTTFDTRIFAGATTFTAGKVWYVRLDTATKRILDFVPWHQTAGLGTWVDDNGNTWTGQGSAVINAGMLAYSRVPADCLADFIRSPIYGLGKRVDLRYLLQVVAWNAEVLTGPPAEPRHLIDLSLEDSRPAEDWLNVLRDYAHCWVVPEGGTYYLIRDANDGVEGSFTASEIISKSLQIKKRGARNQPTVVQVTWTDTSLSPWREVPETVYFPGVLNGTVPRRMSKISKPGITRRSEAYRYAVERLNDATLSDTNIECTLDDSATKVRVGGIYNFTHPIGLTNKPFRVMRMRYNKGRYNISATEFDPALYSSTVVTQPTIVDTTLPNPNAPPPVTGLSSTEDIVQTKDGLYVSRIRVDWTPPANFPFAFIGSYRVQIYDNAVPPVLVHQADITSRPMVTPPLKELVPYTCTVSVVSSTGVVSAGTSTTITPQGKYLPPSDVASVSGFEAGGRVYLSWAAAIDLTLDTIRYEIRYGATTSTWDTATRVDRVSALTYASPGFPTGTYRFFVKALDSVGNYSANAASVDVTVSIDSAAFSAYTYLNQPSDLFAMTENTIAGNRIATTDFGDGAEYGHATHLNTSGTFNDGTVASSVVMTQPHSQCLKFTNKTGAERYVAVPYVAAHNVGTTFTIEAWVYLTSYDSVGRSIFSARTANAAGGWDVRIGSGGVIAWQGTTVIASSADTVPLYKWTHVCCKLTAGTDARIYINGKEISTYTTGPTTAFAFANNTDHRWIGAIRTGALFAMEGSIKRVKLYNTALSDADRLISMQYEDNPTTIAGLVGNWKIVDQGEGSSSTTVADSGSGASNGTIQNGAEWHSWSTALSQPVDLGQAINGTFTISGGDVTSLNGAVSPLILLSNDGLTYTTYKQPTVVASARFFKFGYEAQGGSMSVNFTNLRGDVLVTPRTEVATITCAASGIQTVYLSGLYAKVIDLQTTPAGTPNAWFAVPDQIEVAPFGIAGGSACIKWIASAASAVASRTDTITIGASQTVEAWLYLDSHDGTNGEAAWDLPNNTYAADNFFVNAAGNCTHNGAFGTDVFLNGTATVPFPVGRWTHVAMVVDSVANSTKLYFNGTLVGTTTYRNPTNSASRLWRLGYLGATFGWNGRVYEFRIWNEARTAQQIIDNYKTALGATTNLAVMLRCAEKTGTTLYDSSGNARDFTMAGVSGTDFVWRPINGFDVYLFDAAAARQAGDVRCRWQGA